MVISDILCVLSVRCFRCDWLTLGSINQVGFWHASFPADTFSTHSRNVTEAPGTKAPHFNLNNLRVTKVPTAPTGYQFHFDLTNVGHEAARDLEGRIVMIPLNAWRPPVIIPFSIGNEVFPNTPLSFVSSGVSLDPHSSERYIRISFKYRGSDEAYLTQDISYVWGGIPNFVPSNTFSYPQADVKKRLNKMLDTAAPKHP
jgi:hypothetical protein